MGIIKSGSGFELALGIIIGGCFTLTTLIYIEEGTSKTFDIWVWITIILVCLALLLWLLSAITSLSSDDSINNGNIPDFTTRISPEKRKSDNDW